MCIFHYETYQDEIDEQDEKWFSCKLYDNIYWEGYYTIFYYKFDYKWVWYNEQMSCSI